MHIQGVSAFHFKTPEQLVKVVDFDFCQMLKKLIGYHSNVRWGLGYHKNYVSFVIPIHVTTYTERLVRSV